MNWRNKTEAHKWVLEQAPRLKRPCLVALSGPMGAGKTQLVRWFVEALGGEAPASPTFAIHQSYESKSGTIDHVDLYRLESDADLESTGFWDLFRQLNGLVFVEWADRLPNEVWPHAWQRIFIEIKPGKGEAREVSIGVVEA